MIFWYSDILGLKSDKEKRNDMIEKGGTEFPEVKQEGHENMSPCCSFPIALVMFILGVCFFIMHITIPFYYVFQTRFCNDYVSKFIVILCLNGTESFLTDISVA